MARGSATFAISFAARRRDPCLVFDLSRAAPVSVNSIRLICQDLWWTNNPVCMSKEPGFIRTCAIAGHNGAFSPLACLALLATMISAFAAMPPDYKGTPFEDAFHKTGIPSIPGLVQCALYDQGGEGVAYHDADSINRGSGELNQEKGHQRVHACAYIWDFRRGEGVDLSYVKDWADLNHTNRVSPPINQFYIGWTTNAEWCNYTVNVTSPGSYRIKALYSYQANTIGFDLNGKSATVCKLPVATTSWHHWNLADIGTITFPEAGKQLLTFHYGWGNNFAWFEFEKVEARPRESTP